MEMGRGKGGTKREKRLKNIHFHKDREEIRDTSEEKVATKGSVITIIEQDNRNVKCEQVEKTRESIHLHHPRVH